MTELEILDCCIKPLTINGPNGSISIGPGMSFGPNTQFMGIDLHAALNQIAAKYGR